MAALRYPRWHISQAMATQTAHGQGVRLRFGQRRRQPFRQRQQRGRLLSPSLPTSGRKHTMAAISFSPREGRWPSPYIMFKYSTRELSSSTAPWASPLPCWYCQSNQRFSSLRYCSAVMGPMLCCSRKLRSPWPKFFAMARRCLSDLCFRIFSRRLCCPFGAAISASSLDDSSESASTPSTFGPTRLTQAGCEGRGERLRVSRLEDFSRGVGCSRNPTVSNLHSFALRRGTGQ